MSDWTHVASLLHNCGSLEVLVGNRCELDGNEILRGREGGREGGRESWLGVSSLCIHVHNIHVQGTHVLVGF